MTKIYLLLSLFLFNFFASATEVTYLYTYHKKPPFIVDLDTQRGFYFDLANELNKTDSNNHYQVFYVPRKRLDVMIENDSLQGIVVGVSPIWFKDKSEEKYLWTEGFYRDRDEFVSLKTNPFEYKNSDSLNGKVVGSVAGYYYKDVNEGVKAGDVLRIDTVGELEVLQLIEKQRADIGLVSNSVFKYLKKIQQVNDIFYTSAVPHDEFDRRAFTTKKNRTLYEKFKLDLTLLKDNQTLSSLIKDYE